MSLLSAILPSGDGSGEIHSTHPPTTNMSTPSANEETLVWVVTTPSAYRSFHTCLLGSGSSKAAAIEDAYGPKDSWGKSTKAAVKRADIYQVTETEFRTSFQH